MALNEICLPGSYQTTNGCYRCPALPLLIGNWSHVMEQKSCLGTFGIPAPGIQKAYIPIGVSKVNLTLLESEMQIFGKVSSNGRKSGQLSCILSVPMNQIVYVVVTSTESSDDDVAIGSTLSQKKTKEGKESSIKRLLTSDDQNEDCNIGPYVAFIGTQLTRLVHVSKRSRKSLEELFHRKIWFPSHALTQRKLLNLLPSCNSVNTCFG